MKRFLFKNIQILRLFGILLMIFGGFFFLCLITAFTTLPYQGLHWLGTSLSELKEKPEKIIMLGGGGMPSESNLMRIWYTCHAATAFPGCKIIIATPGDTGVSTSTPQKIKKELVSGGIASDRIIFEPKGTNTRSQAMQSASLSDMKSPVLLITSPEHMRRSILTFRKAGFTSINALPAFENASEADFSFNDKDLGGKSVLVPGVGKNEQLRYQVWNHLKFEIIITRELTALLYYRIRGWI
jgi:uncharacterized SAM-binding protein YcdF (DUF218 family)